MGWYVHGSLCWRQDSACWRLFLIVPGFLPSGHHKTHALFCYFDEDAVPGIVSRVTPDFKLGRQRTSLARLHTREGEIGPNTRNGESGGKWNWTNGRWFISIQAKRSQEYRYSRRCSAPIFLNEVGEWRARTGGNLECSKVKWYFSGTVGVVGPREETFDPQLTARRGLLLFFSASSACAPIRSGR